MEIILKDINDDLILTRGDERVRVFNQLKGIKESDKWVDLGLPSGTLWAKANIDVTTQSKFQEVDGEISPYTHDMSYFSYGNTDGHNPDANDDFDYNFGGINAQSPWYDGQPYGSTTGDTFAGGLNVNLSPSFDAAYANLGAPWRMPTVNEFAELGANVDFIDAQGNVLLTPAFVTIEGIDGYLLKSKINGNTIFFPTAGAAIGTERLYLNFISIGLSTNITGVGSDPSKSRMCSTSSNGQDFFRNVIADRYQGLPIRPVL